MSHNHTLTLPLISSYCLFHYFTVINSHVASEVLSVTDEDLTAISFLLDAEDEVREERREEREWEEKRREERE